LSKSSNGNPTGEEVEFVFPASFDEKGNLTTEAQAIFPAQNITVELYKDGNSTSSPVGLPL